jgi:hypothetical protein
MSKEKKKVKKSFVGKYKWWFIGAGIALILIYVIIYLCFRGNGFLSTGIDLEKKDWLAFLGAYLSFGGTVVVSAIAILQSHYFDIKQKERDADARNKHLQPVFSVTLGSLNCMLRGEAEALSLNDPSLNRKHQNVTINIENVGEYPIFHVIIFDKYKYQLLKPNEKKSIQVAFEDSPDASSKNESLIHILRSEYESTKDNIPMWFNIVYEDIDGNTMYQTFDLKYFESDCYYSLTSREEQ